MLRRLPLYPLLVAAFPVLLLWTLNAREVTPADVLPVLGTVLAAAVVAFVVAALGLRDVRRGALVATGLAVVALGHGLLWGTGSTARFPGLLVAAVALVVVVVRVRGYDAGTLGTATVIGNVIAVLLIVATAPGIAGSVRAAGITAAGPVGAAGTGTALLTPDGTPRDIIWIVPDRYGGADGLAATFDIDTGGFTDELAARGFVVARDARANYPRTSHSLAAQLNLTYLDELAATIPEDGQDDVTPLHQLLRDHEVGRVLTDAGYEYVHLASWWDPTATATSADRVIDYDTTSEFARVFEETTVLPALGIGTGGTELTGRDRIRAATAFQLDALDRIAREIAADTTDAPKFVFAHVALPHEPYVFDRDGAAVDLETERSRSRADNFARQLAYLDDRLLDVVDTVDTVGTDRAPVVLIQADEGPHPEELEFGGRDGYRWTDVPAEDLLTKLSILSAFRLPGADADALVRDDMTGVNAMRLVLDTYVGTELGQLPDRSFIYPDDSMLYRFTDVTAVLDDQLR